MLIYYVYAYLREDGSPYYIGKGKSDRAYKRHTNVPVPKDHSKIIFLETNLTEIGALALERRYIQWYGRKDNHTGILRNLTDGGEGVSGATFLKGIPRSDYARQRISEGKLGKPCSEQTKQKISATKTGVKRKPFSTETIAKMKIAAKLRAEKKRISKFS